MGGRGCQLIARIGPLTERPSPARQAVAFLVATVVGMMIVPVPPFLLDLLLVLNISISMVMVDFPEN